MIPALLAALALAQASPSPAPAPERNDPLRAEPRPAGEDDAVIEHLDLLEQLELLESMELLDPGADEPREAD